MTNQAQQVGETMMQVYHQKGCYAGDRDTEEKEEKQCQQGDFH